MSNRVCRSPKKIVIDDFTIIAREYEGHSEGSSLISSDEEDDQIMMPKHVLEAENNIRTPEVTNGPTKAVLPQAAR